MQDRIRKLCYVLVLAAFPASMVLVAWMPPGILHGWLADNAPGLRTFLQEHVFTVWTSYPQLLGAQTLAALLFCMAAALWLCGPRRAGDLMQAVRSRPFVPLVLAYGTWAGLSWLWSAWRFGTLAYFMRELPFYVLAIGAAVVCARRTRWRRVAWAFALSASAQAWFQTFVVVYMARRTDVPYRKALLDNAVAYGNPNFGCAIQVAAGLIILALLIDALRRVRGGERFSGGRVVLLVLLLCSLPALGFLFVVSASLAGKVAAAAAVSAWALAVLPIPGKKAIVGGAAALCAIALLTVAASEPLRTKALRNLLSPRNTTSLRIVDWLAAKELYLRRPLHGWGMGTFPATYARYHPPLARKLPFTSNHRTTHPHNEYVRVAADQGCVGLFLYLGVLGFAFGTSWKRLKEEPPGVSVVGWALWAGALGFAVQAAFGKAPMYWSFSGPMWLLLGVLASARGWPGPDDDPGDEAASEAQSHCSPVAAAALLVVCAGTAFLWWDWGLRPYASAVEMGRAQWLQKHMHDPEHGPAMFEEFRAHIRHARSRCLWADEILHADYVTGWYLTTHREWAEGARVLEKVQELAPEFLRTRLFLAECYFGLRRPQEARRELGEYMARDPHDLAAYRLMSYVDGRAAAEALLSPHVMSRLEQQPNWIVEDHPTGDEVRMLLDLQVRLGKLEEARRSFLSAREFFARAQLSRQVNVDAEVRKLARTYTDEGEEHLASAVRRLMPEAFARGGSGRGQS